MRIRGVDHLVLTVADVEATVAFYERLGMHRELFGGDRIALRFGEQKLNLHPAGAEIAPHARRPTPGSADLCFLVEGRVEDVAAELTAAGISIELGPVGRTGAQGRSARSIFATKTATSSNYLSLSQTPERVGRQPIRSASPIRMPSGPRT